MKKILMLLLAAALVLPFSCTKPDTPSGEGTEQGGGTENNGGSENGSGDNTGGGETPEVKTYKPGDYYKVGLAEGIVAWVDETGEKGLLLSLDETRAAWSTEYVGLTDMAIPFSQEDGMINTKYIKELEGWKDAYPAFAWCDSKNPKGLSSWYLPAMYELDFVYMSFDAINAGLEAAGATKLSNGPSDCYWTSVEGGAMIAYCFSFFYGEISSYDNDKKNEHRVRAVRKF